MQKVVIYSAAVFLKYMYVHHLAVPYEHTALITYCTDGGCVRFKAPDQLLHPHQTVLRPHL